MFKPRSFATVRRYRNRGIGRLCAVCSRLKAQFPLVTEGEDAHLLSCNHKSIQGDVTGSPIGNDQFAHFARDAPADQRVSGEIIDCRADGCHGVGCSIGMFVAQISKSVFEVFQRTCRIDYRRHGFGRAGASSAARRCIQACTSSAL